MKKVTFLLFILAGMIWGCGTDGLQSDISPLDTSVVLKSKKSVPLKGNLTFTTVSRSVGFPAVEVFEGNGNMNHLGRVTCKVTQIIPSPNSGFYGTMEITAANGDQLVFSYTGGLINFNPQISLAFTSHIDFEVTGGSGRFSNATGSGEGAGAGVFPQFPPVDALTVRSILDGEISY